MEVGRAQLKGWVQGVCLKGYLRGHDSKGSCVAGCEGKERCPTHQQASLEEGPQWYYNG